MRSIAEDLCGKVKPIRIWSRTGRRPIVAVGNSNGDVPMLRWAGGAGRRCACSSTTTIPIGSSPTPPAETALERAGADGWTVVSVRHDWAAVYADAR